METDSLGGAQSVSLGVRKDRDVFRRSSVHRLGDEAGEAHLTGPQLALYTGLLSQAVPSGAGEALGGFQQGCAVVGRRTGTSPSLAGGERRGWRVGKQGD